MENERRSGGGDSVPISVRSINGESTTVQVSSDGTIRDLKKALKSCFPPASSSSNFHLYIKVMLIILLHSFAIAFKFRFLNQLFKDKIRISLFL